MPYALLFSLLLWPPVAAAQIPVLQVSPASLAFSLDGRSQAAPQQVRIRNLGSGTLRWTARSEDRWVRVTPPSGSGPAVLNVEIDGARLGAGRHEGRITIDAPDADDAPVSIAVSVEVAGRQAPPPAAAPAPLAATPPDPGGKPASGPPAAPAGASAPASDASSRGPLRLERRVLPPATRNLPYVQAVPVAGGTPPYAIRIIEGRLPRGLVLAHGAISGTARVQGYYPFVVAVTDASTPPVTIAQPLGLRVMILQPDTALVVSPLSIALRLPGRRRDGRATLAVGSGRQRLEWSASADAPWITLAPSSGVSPATLDVIALASRLSPGTHLGTVTVTMEGAPNSPASIPVQVTVPR
jgi:peptidoglycan hydrolase-like protein with peptidoglycan-binding domain